MSPEVAQRRMADAELADATLQETPLTSAVLPLQQLAAEIKNP